MSRFLVTGGAGFIGSHIAEKLVRQGHFVRVMDNFVSGKIENLRSIIDRIELQRGDIRSPKACLKATKSIDFVLHQAALRSVPKSMGNPREYNDVNINGTLNILEASKLNKVKRLVFASSSSVYGDISKFPEREDFPSQLISPYALTKLCGEYYCKIFSYHHGLAAVSLRYFNVFGPRQALDDEYAVVIPKFITCMLNGEQPPIYGTGRQSRDFTFVDNVVNANLLAARSKVKSGVFNVASGKDYTVLELVKILNRIMRKKIKPKFLKPRPGDVFRTLADLKESRKFLGFSPKINFEDGLKITVEYFKENA